MAGFAMLMVVLALPLSQGLEVEVGTGVELAAAIVDSNVTLARVVRSLHFGDEDWATLPVPYTLDRNLTIEGAADEDWPLLTMPARRKVVLASHVVLTFRHLHLYRFGKDNFLRAPGIDLLQASPAGTVGARLHAQETGTIGDYCFPIRLMETNWAAVPRPTDLPRLQDYRFLTSQPGCLNVTTPSTVPLGRRCWPAMQAVYDMGLPAMELDLTSRPQPASYTVHVSVSWASYRIVLTDECSATLGPLGELFAISNRTSLPPLFPDPTGPGAGVGASQPPPQPQALAPGPPEAAGPGQPYAVPAWAIGVGCAVGGAAVCILAAVGFTLVWPRLRGVPPGPAEPGPRPDVPPSSKTPSPGASSADALVSGSPAPALPGMTTRAPGVAPVITEESGTAPNAAPFTAAPEEVLRLSYVHPPAAVSPQSPRSHHHRHLPSGPRPASAGVPRPRSQAGLPPAGAFWPRSQSSATAAAGPAAAGLKARLEPAHLDSTLEEEGAAEKALQEGPGPGPASGSGEAAAEAQGEETAGSGIAAANQSGSGICSWDQGAVAMELAAEEAAEVEDESSMFVQLRPVVLGKGGFGRVQEGVYRGQVVAVKQLADGLLEAAVGDTCERAASLLQELEVLARCRHPNIVTLLGASLGPRPFMVLERMEISLERLLYGEGPSRELLPLPLVIHIGGEIAAGLEYLLGLHPYVLHRDLKPGNVLINDPWGPTPVVKISDFGLSRLRETILLTAHPGAGTAAYMAPEDQPAISYKADMYSFGVLMWEMPAGVQPWEGLGHLNIALAVAFGGLRLPMPSRPPAAESCGGGGSSPGGGSCAPRWPPRLVRLLAEAFDADPLRRLAALCHSSSSSINSRSDQEARGSGLMGSLLGVDVETVRVAALFISNGGTPQQESFRRQQSSKRFTSAAPMATSTWALMLPDLDACSTTTPISVGRQPSVSALTRPRGVLGPPPLSKAVSDNVAGLASACTRDGHSMSSALASTATAAATTTAVDVRSGDDASSELLHTDRLGPLPSHLASAARASVTLRGSKSFTLGRRATAPQDSPTEGFAQPRRPLLDATPGSSMSRSRSQTALNALDPPPPDELGAPATAANARSAARRHSVLSLLAVGSREHAADSGGSTHSGAPRLLQFASSLVNAPTASGMEGSRLTSRPSHKALALRTGSGSVAAGGAATGEDEDPGLSSAADMVARLRTYSFRAPAVPGAADRARLAALASPTEHPRQVSLRAATGKGEAEEQGPTQQQQQPEAEAGVAAAEARAGPETGRAWHEVCAAAVEDPDSGARYLVVMQRDVTAKVEAERHIAQVSEMEHRLLEQVFPRHVLAYMTEEGCQPAPAPEDEGPSDGDAAPPTPTWRPQVRDCTRLATWHPQVTILFADIQGFTPMCKQLPACVVMKFLNDLFVRFDSLLDVHGVYKVATIGDCYVVAGGLIAEDADGMAAVQGGGVSDPRQANQVFSFAQAMLHAAAAVTLPTTGEPVRIRVGIHSGPVVSGVVGTRMPRFCLFGDTVNTASRMESTSQAGAIHASSDTFVLLSPDQRQGWAPTGGIEVKGKGRMDTFLWGDAVAVAVE
ncbi:hypothetical protein HYH03_011238 [Edaphochlamys debaryana]|uniref:Guanylate cyclase n=1 Tax=Edaphochlamys debaryana TaxID=47281 RepID=A0A836BV57_9CHLO|nr:hypothetical protein HYH03_011238 [Edaphochlamys debaryana]|eukprot:KAG2490286.1 hypothetical protein HYH03_011238 [Edaphochlamys debaryana]